MPSWVIPLLSLTYLLFIHTISHLLFIQSWLVLSSFSHSIIHLLICPFLILFHTHAHTHTHSLSLQVIDAMQTGLFLFLNLTYILFNHTITHTHTLSLSFSLCLSLSLSLPFLSLSLSLSLSLQVKLVTSKKVMLFKLHVHLYDVASTNKCSFNLG